MIEKSLTFGDYWFESKRMINRALEDFLSQIKRMEIADMAKGMIAGGKRFRGCLCLLVCDALGGSKKIALDAAVALELLQAASLTHDDILDLSIARRGKPATHLMHGVAKAVIMPYIIVSHAKEILAKYGLKSVFLAERAIRTIAIGELMDVLKTASYEVIVKAKTAEQFALSAVLGAVVADAEEEMMQLARSYGINVGVAYQVMDDLCDLVRGKPVLGLTSIDNGRKMIRKNMKLAREYATRFPETLFRPLLYEAPQFMINKLKTI